jgi:hypothetical protein
MWCTPILVHLSRERAHMLSMLARRPVSTYNYAWEISARLSQVLMGDFCKANVPYYHRPQGNFSIYVHLSTFIVYLTH